VRGGPGWSDLLTTQAGILTVAQAREHGWTRHAVEAQVAAGRWARLHRGVLATFTGDLTYEQRVWSGLLYAGRGAAVSHESALWLHDRDRTPPATVHITVARRRDAARAEGLRVYRSDLGPDEVMDLASPPRVTVERAVVECAGAARSDEQAIAVVAEAIQRRLTTAERLRRTLEKRPCLRHRALLLEILDMCGAGAHSLLEVRHEQIRRSHGLPEPVRQVRHEGAVVDVDYDGLIVELDGRTGHFNVSGWWKDMLRDDMHTAAGRAVLRWPSFVLLTQPNLVAHLEAEALRRRGWTGVIRCPPGCPGLPEAVRG
jgi:very-short-patch-repair endonuclease